MPKSRKPKVHELEYVLVPPAPESLGQLVALIASLVDFVLTLYVGKETTKTRRDFRARVNTR